MKYWTSVYHQVKLTPTVRNKVITELARVVILSPVRASLSRLVKLQYKAIDHLLFRKQHNISKSSIDTTTTVDNEEDYPAHIINLRMPF